MFAFSLKIQPALDCSQKIKPQLQVLLLRAPSAFHPITAPP
jgi:hypothetical protein